MTNARISERGFAVLRNKPLASAIASAIVNGSYTPEGDGIVVHYKGKQFIIRTASYPTEQKLNNKKK